MPLGDLVYRGASLWLRLLGNTTTTRKFLSQTGSGAASAAPAWNQVADADLSTTDITTNDVSITKHGFAPKAPNNTTTFLRGDATWGTPAATVAAPFTGNQAPGSFTIATEQFGLHGFRLKLTSTQRGTIAGTGRLIISG